MSRWNQCNICGKFIGLDEFCGKPPLAVNTLINPSGYGAEEEWDTHHIACKAPTITDRGSDA